MLIILGASGGIGGGLLDHVKRLGLADRYGGILGSLRSQCDLTSEDSISTFLDSVMPTCIGPLYLLNAAGHLANGILHKLPTTDLATTLKVNVEGSFHLLKHFRRVAKSRPGSSALLLSSVVAPLGVAGATSYGASKAAIEGLVRSAAKEFAPLGLRVNCIRLGYFDVGMIHRIPPAIRDSIKSTIPLGRFGTIGDLYPMCEAALLSPYTTGACLDVNGGLP